MAIPKEIIIGVTGGISAYKACDVVRQLAKKGYAVTVLMTPEAGHFVGELTFRTLSGRPVVQDMFREPMGWDPCHIGLADKADAIAIVPATARCIAGLAHAACDDVISCVISATKAPVIICPAMNDAMYGHPGVQENIKRLASFGYRLVGPVEGDLACGRRGTGHLADVADIVAAIEQAVT